MYVKPYVENRTVRVIQFVIRDVILFVPWEQLQFTNRVEFASSFTDFRRPLRICVGFLRIEIRVYARVYTELI